MKNILLATTVLAATAGFASADVKVSGYGFAGATTNGTTTTAASGLRLEFTGSAETDGGIKMSAYTRVTNGTPGTTPVVNTAGVAGGDVFARNKVTISANGLTVAVGSTNGAMKSLARNAAYYGFNDGGVAGFDNNASTLNDSGNNVFVQYAVSSVKVGIGSNIPAAGAATVIDFGAQYSSNGFTVGAGADNTAGASKWMVAASYDGGAWSVGVGTASNNDVTLKASYDIGGGTTIGVAGESTGGNTNFGLDVSHDLGGATASFTAAQVAGATSAGAGIIFKF
jgi:outer membrane protein OmpU